jgi:hypothetical protein
MSGEPDALIDCIGKSGHSDKFDDLFHTIINMFYAALREQASPHQFSTLALIMSRTSRVLANFSSYAPWKLDGSGKPQCKRELAPGKIGQRSALVSSQTVMTQ